MGLDWGIPLFKGGIVNRPVRYGAPVQALSLCECFSFKQWNLSKLCTDPMNKPQDCNCFVGVMLTRSNVIPPLSPYKCWISKIAPLSLTPLFAALLIVSPKKFYLLTGGSYWPKTKASELHFARSFKGHPTWPYFARPNMHANMHIWHIWPYLAYLGTYLGASTMVKWGVPEKILQNAVQTRWS